MAEVVYPIYGEFNVTSDYGPRNAMKLTNGDVSSSYHYGIDLVPVNMNSDSKYARAVTSGEVVYARAQSGGKGYGNYVWVSGEDGKGTIYAHLDSFCVKEGQKVYPGDKLGVIGKTGGVTGLHLHFGVSNSGSYSATHSNKQKYFIDPKIYLGMPSGRTHKGSGRGFNSTGELDRYKKEDQEQENTSIATKGTINSMVIPSGEYYEVKDVKGTTSDWLYGRRYRVIVDVGNNDAVDVSELRCVFDIKKSAYTQVQTSTVKIYNLAPDDENKIIEGSLRVIIEAGYNGSYYGKIFEGNITQVLRSKEGGVDYCLTLVVVDSDRYVASGIINKSLAAQQSERDAINALSSASTVKSEIGIISQTQIREYPRGKVMFGKAKDYLAQIAKSNNAQYYNENGKINIIGTEYDPGDEIFMLSPDSGLLDFPVQTQYGITCVCLLNPFISLNSLFMVENKRIETFQYTYGTVARPLDSNGIYRAIELNYKGDTRGRDWRVEITALSQAGSLPAMAAGGGILIF